LINVEDYADIGAYSKIKLIPYITTIVNFKNIINYCYRALK